MWEVPSKLLHPHLAHHAREDPIDKGGLEFVNLAIPVQGQQLHSSAWLLSFKGSGPLLPLYSV